MFVVTKTWTVCACPHTRVRIALQAEFLRPLDLGDLAVGRKKTEPVPVTARSTA